MASQRGLQVRGAEMTRQPKDENDHTQLRRFAKRIAEMKWWNDKSNSDKPAETRDQENTNFSALSIDRNRLRRHQVSAPLVVAVPCPGSGKR
jgi:hypothetical protein